MSEPWIKLQRNLPRHPRAAVAGSEGMWLFVCGLCYCDEYGTDGLIPINAVGSLTNTISKPERAAKALLKSGLWEEDGEYYVVRNYLRINRSAKEIAEQKQRRSASGRRAAAKRWGLESDANTHADRIGKRK